MGSEALNIGSAINGQSNGDSAGIARDQIRGSSLFLVGNVISLAITFLPHLALVRFLSTEAYGHWAYALSLVAVGKTYALGFNEAMSRFVPIYDTKRELPKLLGSIVVIFGVTLLLSGLLVGAFAAAPNVILGFLTKGREAPGLLLILMFLVPLEALDLLIVNLFACFGRARIIFWARYIIPPALRAVCVIAVIFKHLTLRPLAYGYLLVEAITILLFSALIANELRRHKLFPTFTCIQLPFREICGFSLPLMASNIVGMFGTSIPVLLLGYFHSASAVAYYRVVLPAAVITSMIPANFMALYIPAASRLFARGDMAGINQLFWKTSLWMTALAFPLFLATTCFARPLTTLLYGTRYSPSVPILAVLSFGYFVNVVFAFSGVTLKVLGKVRVMVALNIATPLIIVILNVLLIPRHGALGAAIATASGMVVQNVLRQIGLWRYSAGIGFFERRYASFFLILVSSTLGLFLIERFTRDHIYLGLTSAFGVALFVLWLVQNHLRFAEVFPELLRIPFAAKLLG